MILIRNDITPHVDIPEEKPVDNHMEIIWIKTKSKPPIHIGAYYGTQENCNMDVITEEYENLTGSISGKINGNNELILLGDFNAKLEIAHNEVVQKQSSREARSKNCVVIYSFTVIVLHRAMLENHFAL